MLYRELPPPPALRSVVRCFWILRDAQGAGTVERVLPDGCVEIVVHRGTPMVRQHADGRQEVQPDAVVAGQLRTAALLASTGPVDMIGVRFEPWAGASVLRASLGGLTDGIVPLEDLDCGLPADLVERVQEAPDDEQRVALLSEHLLARLSGRDDDVEALRATVARIQATRGAVAVADLAAGLGWSRRRLERCFAREVGLSPKALCRVVRFQRILNGLEEPGRPSLAALALDGGYADQAHLARDFRDLAGLSITRYLAEQHALSDCFTFGGENARPS